MNISCGKENLLKALSICVNAVNERTSVEALKCFKLEALENKLIITSNNLETNIISELKATVNKSGKTLVHAKTFFNIISKLPAGEVTIYLSENNTVIIQGGNSTFNIFTSNINDFPENMKIEEYKEIKLDINMFKDMVRRVSFAASNEEEKLILNGVLVDILKDQQKLLFVAADGYRLAKDDINFETNENITAIIPIMTIKEALNIINILEVKELVIRLGQNKVLFLCDHISLYSRLITGKFPDYKLLIPQEHKLQIKINRKELLDGCERINIIAQRNSYMVKIEVIEENLVISSVTPDFGDGSEKIKIKTKGDKAIQVIFNVRLMIEVLKNLETDQIFIDIINDEKPIVIKEENNKEYIYIMMPIKVKRD
ncbi:MAG: DNA polymerase III subunit beta [Candidatus Margulisbacteria bacterium]|nr:DNA polymerase III subunit beta [Candidatus Margulisiibacteriota bacterium]